MQKTRLGVSVGLFGAMLYFVGLVSIIPLVLMAGYVLLAEENMWLKRAAVKAVGVVLFFAVLSALIGLVGNFSTFLTETARLFNGQVNMTELNRIITICRTVLSFVQAMFLIMLGIKALKQGDVKFSVVDNHLADFQRQSPSGPAVVACPVCNKVLSVGTAFCNGCGNKL